VVSASFVVGGPLAAAEAKTLRMAYDADPTSLDPHEQIASATLQLSHLTFDPLLRFRQDLTLEPRLAKTWKKIDERTTRFYLREGVRFHSGRTLSAEDVVWTFNRLKQSPDFKALFEPFSEAKAVDDLTVDLNTKGPYPLVLKRFADYWDQASPGNVDRIILTPIKEPATRIAALLAGDVDFIAPVPLTDFDRIKGDPCCQLITMLSTRILTFELNQARVAAFKDPRVRLAINYAINRQGIVDKIMRGFGTPAGELSPPS
jgi:peptide/nickel transport system substrate-binding protein